MSGARLDKGEQDGYFCLRGELTFDTVADLLDRGEALLAGWPSIRIDLADVSRADSAGLALLAEWTRRAALARQVIDFINTPAQFRALAHVSGLDQVLPLDRLRQGQ